MGSQAYRLGGGVSAAPFVFRSGSAGAGGVSGLQNELALAAGTSGLQTSGLQNELAAGWSWAPPSPSHGFEVVCGVVIHLSAELAVGLEVAKFGDAAVAEVSSTMPSGAVARGALRVCDGVVRIGH
jgi:hypothetical protein